LPVPRWHGECIDLDMKQQTLAMAADQNAQYERFRKPTERDMFLATMEQDLLKNVHDCSA
jgi:hypothetical protein